MLNHSPHTILLSLEGLCGKVPDHRNANEIYPHANDILKLVESVFSMDSLTFLFSTRDVPSWITSAHAHRVRTRGLIVPKEKFAALGKYQRLDWQTLCNQTMSGIRAQYHIVPMEADIGSYFGPGSRFLELICPDGSLTKTWRPTVRSNVGLDERSVELARRKWMHFIPAKLRRMIIENYDRRLI